MCITLRCCLCKVEYYSSQCDCSTVLKESYCNSCQSRSAFDSQASTKGLTANAFAVTTSRLGQQENKSTGRRGRKEGNYNSNSTHYAQHQIDTVLISPSGSNDTYASILWDSAPFIMDIKFQEEN
ncbi:hypothetical protein ARMGADRAFT_553351 [Armillaria gallica]|uniref:Uncharacterized protein n=1 Tax=Armillaria gallica TaxID=47427 RepID=A0A2H3D9K0_ARMGA|nr:hypothetical protein ARMGADRAFT_553351 [Armillaria gallica]